MRERQEEKKKKVGHQNVQDIYYDRHTQLCCLTYHNVQI